MAKRAILLDALSSTPSDIFRFTKHVDEVSAVWRPAESQRSCIEVIEYLSQVESVYLGWFQTIISQDLPILSCQALSYQAPDMCPTLADSTRRFQVHRDETTRFLKSLSPGSWQKKAIHPLGRICTLRTLVQDLVNHDIDQTNQLVIILHQRRRFLAEATTTG